MSPARQQMPFVYAWDYLGSHGAPIRRERWPAGSFVVKVRPQPFYFAPRVAVSLHRPSGLTPPAFTAHQIQLEALIVLVNRGHDAKPWTPTLEDVEAKDWQEVIL